MSRNRLLGLLALGVLGGAAIVGLMMAGRSATMDAYAGWHAAGLVIFHRMANGGQWPLGWDDLRDDFDAHYSGRGASFRELQDRVVIDFASPPAAVPSGPTGAFAYIRLRSGSRAHWAGAEPNQLIKDHLSGKEFLPQDLNAR